MDARVDVKLVVVVGLLKYLQERVHVLQYMHTVRDKRKSKSKKRKKNTVRHRT